jgi:hypothetical protein
MAINAAVKAARMTATRDYFANGTLEQIRLFDNRHTDFLVTVTL